MTAQLTIWEAMPRRVSHYAETSRQAYAEIRPSLNAMQAKILAVIASKFDHGMTCDEVEIELGMLHQTASARVRELRDKYKIRISGRMRKTRRGKNADVYVVVD